MDLLQLFTFALLIVHGCYPAGIVEKSTTVCNGPCGQLTLSCPTGHRVAIRDAVNRLQVKTPTCTTTPQCTDPQQEPCCEQSRQDCVYSYPMSQLRSLQRNCSGANSCLLQTEKADGDVTLCPTTNTSRVTSQTILNYVCISDSLVSEICHVDESVVSGITLFARLDGRTPANKRLAKGSVCTCTAETTRWPTNNSIAVFVVDTRLNRPEVSDCANASLTVRSVNNNRVFDCASNRDPRVNYPFVTVLNESNVAHLRFQVTSDLPEYIWVGFEANLNEDIRVSCKLQGVVPIKQDEPKAETKPSDTRVINQDSKAGMDMTPAIIGGVVAGVVLVAVVIFVSCIFCKRLPSCPPSSKPIDDDQGEVDIDRYYSTTEDEMRNLELAQAGSARHSVSSTQELYISPEDVRANKRNNAKVKSPILASDVFDDDDEYITAFEVRSRKRESQKDKNPDQNGGMPANETNYDRLGRQSFSPNPDVMENYDKLVPASVPELSAKKSEPDDQNPDGRVEAGALNLAYTDTEKPEISGSQSPTYETLYNSKVKVAPTLSATYCNEDKSPDVAPERDAASVYDTPRSAKSKLLSVSRRDSDDTPTDIGPLVDKNDETLEPNRVNENNDADDLQKVPVAKPRRKGKSVKPYDLAKPIQ